MDGIKPAKYAWLYWGMCACFVLFLACNYFLGLRFFPHSHGDEASLLDIPYRWSHYGDLRFPVFWSRSFGAAERRFTPPVAAVTLRNLYHAVVGCAPVLSRAFSAALFFCTIMTVPLLLRRLELGRWQSLLVLCQVAFAPVVILAARSTRTEQEVLVAGWFGAVVLPCLIPALRARWARAICWCAAGGLMALSGASHPLGAACAVAGLWILANTRNWHEWDGFRLWQRLALLILGAAVVAVPTIQQLTDPNTRGYVEHVTELYKVRDIQLTPYLASLAPWNWLRDILPDAVVARFNVLHAASYADFFDYPVANYRFRAALIMWYYAELVLVLGYFLFSVCRRFRNGTPWLHLVVLLALAFPVVNLWFFPVFTYAIYSTFYVTLAAGIILCRLGNELHRSWPRLRSAAVPLAGLYLAGSGLVLHYAFMHTRQVMASVRHHHWPHVSLDQEFAALEEMGRKLDLKRDDKIVYTSTESWIAAGKNNESLWESIMLGLVEPRADAAGAVFKNVHMEFFLGVYGADIPSRFPSRQQRLARLDKLLCRLHLSGVILSDWEQEGAYCLYTDTPGEADHLAVARMRRSLETEYHDAVLQEELYRPESVTLAPGTYVLCVWTAADARGAVLEISDSATATIPLRVSMGSLFRVAPAPALLQVSETSREYRLRCRAAKRTVPLRKLQVYRLQ